MASIDLALLRVIKYKEQYDKVARYIPMGAINKRTKLVAKDIGRYFEENDNETMINFNITTFSSVGVLTDCASLSLQMRYQMVASPSGVINPLVTQ